MTTETGVRTSAVRPAGAVDGASTRPPVDRRRRRRMIGWSIAAAVALVSLAALAAVSPLLDVEHVDVVGAPADRSGEVRAAAGIQPGDSIITFLPGRVASRVRALPWVAQVSVARRLPSRVRITVVPRTAVGWVHAGSQFLLVDGSGRALYRVDQQPGGIPELLGVTRAAQPGRNIRPAELARVAGRLVPELRIRSTTLGIDQDALTVGVVGGPQVRFGTPTDVTTKARVAAAVLASLGGAPVQYVDVGVPAAPVSG